MRIDLNADLGERPGALVDDERILDSITSANVACGFHAGTLETMRFVCERAVGLGVSIGAHVSYRDRANFGRAAVEVGHAELVADIVEQLETLSAVSADAGTRTGYVKPHGALYNRCANDRSQSVSVVDAVLAVDANLRVLCLPDSALATVAGERGLISVAEGYADRGYRADGRLVQRDQPGAILDREQSVRQALALAAGGTVRSLCLHSDTAGASALASSLRRALEDAGVSVEAFA